MRNRRTLTINAKIYEKFKIICEKNNFKISKHAESILLEYIEKMEKNSGKNK